MPNLEVQLERLSKKLPELMRVGATTIYDQLKTAEVVKVGEKNFRMPSQLTTGWTQGAVDTNGGANLRGTSPSFNEMVGTFQEFGMATELTTRQQNVLSGNSEISAVNILPKSIAAMVPEWQKFMESMMYSNGRPFCFTATAQATVSGTTQYTGDTIIGARRLVRGCAVTAYDTTGVTVKATGYVVGIDYTLKTVRLSVLVAGAANTDIMTYGVYTASNPTGMYGLKFWNDNASSGTILGVDRALEPDVRATNVAAASAVLTQEMALLLQDRINVRMGSDNIDPDMRGYIAPAQRAAVIASVTAIQQVQIGTGPSNNVDRMSGITRKTDFEWAGGLMHRYTLLQDSDRIDYFNLKKFNRAVSKDIDFYQNAKGERLFPIYSTVNGAPMFTTWMGVYCAHQIFCVEPRHGGYISGLAITANY